MFEGAKVLVTGGGGFIGTNIIERLLPMGCRIRATIHDRNPQLLHPSIEYVKADLTSKEDCAQVAEGIDYVFMCSASTSGAAVMTSTPLAHVTPNVVMNALMMEAAHHAGVKKYLFMSSSAAYPPTGDRPATEEEMFQGDPYEVYYSVGWMKRYAEILCRVYSLKIKPPMPTVVVRPSNIYGRYDKFDFARSHVTAALLRRVVERHDPLVVWGTGNDVRDLIYVDDFLDGLLAAFEYDAPFLEVNIASGQGYSVKQVLQTLIAIDGFHDARVEFDPSKPTTIPSRYVDTTRAKDMLGFEARTSLEDGLCRTVEWYKRHPASRAH